MELYYVGVRDVCQDDGDSETNNDVQNYDNVSFSGSMESTDDDNVDIEQVVPPSSSTSINIVPAATLTDLYRQEMQEQAPEPVQQQLELK